MKKNRILKFITAAIIAATASIAAWADGLLISPAPKAVQEESSTQGTETSAEEAQTAETPVTDDTKAAEEAPLAEDTTAVEEKIVFSDIAEDSSYKAAVYKLVENGVLNGYPDGTFRPDGKLTRAEMCKMINLTFGYTDTEGAAGFPDLVAGEWYVPYVLAAQKAGYVQGDDVGTFRPEDDISREEVCAILYRIIKPYDLPIPVTINDTVSEWAKPYVEAMVKNALIPLEEGGMFRATEPIKRHELASAVAPHSNIKIDDIKCKVTFMNGETVVQTVEVSIGKGIENMPAITEIPVGYKFTGWSRTPEEPVLVDSSFIFVEDSTLHAYFDKCEYTVKFVIDNSTVVSTVTAKYKEFAVKPVDPKKKGYTFEGWTTGTDGKIVDVSKYEITEDTVFTAVFEEEDDGGGFAGGPSGGPSGPSKPSKPSTGDKEDDKDDNTGDDNTGGDNTGDDNTGDDNTGDDNTGGDNTGDDNTGDDNTGGDNTGDDNTGGDNTGDDNTGDDNTGDDNTGDDNDDEEVILSYRVTFIVDGEPYGDEQIVEKGNAPEDPEDPELKGYVFLYWSYEEDGERVNLEDEEIVEDTVFYAVFALEEENPNDPEIIASLKKAALQFKAMRISDSKQKQVRTIVIDTINKVLEDAENGEYIDSDYVKENYKSDLEEVKELLDKKMSKGERSDFISRVSNSVDEDTFNILADFFLSEETKEDYFG